MRRRPPYSPAFLGLWEKTDKVFGRVLDNPHREGDGRVPLASALFENVGDTRYVCGVHGGLSNIEAVYEDVFRCLKDEPLQLPKNVAGALSGHLAVSTPSKAPHLDGTAAVCIMKRVAIYLRISTSKQDTDNQRRGRP